jgi:hypothetical protein
MSKLSSLDSMLLAPLLLVVLGLLLRPLGQFLLALLLPNRKGFR